MGLDFAIVILIAAIAIYYQPLIVGTLITVLVLYWLFIKPQRKIASYQDDGSVVYSS